MRKTRPKTEAKLTDQLLLMFWVGSCHFHSRNWCLTIWQHAQSHCCCRSQLWMQLSREICCVRGHSQRQQSFSTTMTLTCFPRWFKDHCHTKEMCTLQKTKLQSLSTKPDGARCLKAQREVWSCIYLLSALLKGYEKSLILLPFDSNTQCCIVPMYIFNTNECLFASGAPGVKNLITV